ncbi:MAG: hypothetical protein AB1489_09970 [Acidobacteriota bacterium]
MNGWLSPAGRFYEVECYEHSQAIEKIVSMTEREAEIRGWIKLSNNHWMIFIKDRGWGVSASRVTQAQVNAIWDLTKAHNVPYPESLKEHS